MKWVGAFLFLFCFQGLLFAQQALETDFGYGEYRLESPDIIFKNIRFKNRFQAKDWFTSEPVPPTGIKFSAFRLGFFKGQLHTIQIKTELEANSRAMLKWLQNRYGDGQQEGYTPRFTWETESVKLVYDENVLTKDAEIRFVSKSIDALFKKEYDVSGEKE